MRELIERSHALQESIMRNKELLGELCERIAQVLDGKVTIAENQAYVFVPRVYRRPLFLPEIFMAAEVMEAIPIPRPEPGPYDPWIVKILDKERLAFSQEAGPDPQSQVADTDPRPWRTLRDQILNDRVLFAELSDAIAETLQSHGVSLAEDETYAFEAITGPKPLFSSQLAAMPIRIARPRGLLARRRALAAQYDEAAFITPWEKGVPAPEILAALEKQRLAWT